MEDAGAPGMELPFLIEAFPVKHAGRDAGAPGMERNPKSNDAGAPGMELPLLIEAFPVEHAGRDAGVHFTVMRIRTCV
jgi:hypothetical protein